ncbi:MAG: alpha/beta hydrolase [Hyphomonas sp.]|uniref:alpha/beta hydrolase n=1 Tax=Hyphomonas sp. TaxID=87 RepID=UPI0017F3DF8A|nr:alpha/beta hydrolase [Hyphomonas sp.]MBU3920026.1 alpha/beta hydrolase [Alphaproteobacteria bacterium]MBA3068165.1 alpha/beta hydrolase [Hyphomonas sp.]MBU4062088.1 alpha/beta hydrolase [Alphaproteobacteria bacterium]MBU4165521.1 alpha/beta hydrolase [Alphaproteobacteria bacterium]MBU4567350.1 alpha/beta hydrolase [Alphaproteobacteria bacterium]
MPDPTILNRLHPDFAPLLAQFAVVPESPPTLDETRAMYRALQPQAPAIAVGEIREAVIPGPAGNLKVRHYIPAGKGPFPVIVHFHGGGFILGDLDTHDAQCRLLCREAGCIVMAVDYRLGPEHPYPAAHEDCFAALRWAGAKATTFGGDAGRIGLAGDSAGGHLALYCALRAKKAGGPALKAMLAIVPGVVMGPPLSDDISAGRERRDNPLLSCEGMDNFVAAYFQDPSDPSDPALNFLGADVSGLPPTIIASAEIDVLHDEGVAMARHLESSGVPTQLMVAEGMVHIYFSVTEAFPSARPFAVKAAKAMGMLMRG